MADKIKESDFWKDLDLKTLKRGDIVQHLVDGDSYVISANYGTHAIGVKTAHISNPQEWRVLKTK